MVKISFKLLSLHLFLNLINNYFINVNFFNDEIKKFKTKKKVLGCYMPTSLYLTTLNRPNGLDYQRSSNSQHPTSIRHRGC